jgi:hypothetical protein
MITEKYMKWSFIAFAVSLGLTTLSICPFIPQFVYWICLGLFALSSGVFIFFTGQIAKQIKK